MKVFSKKRKRTKPIQPQVGMPKFAWPASTGRQKAAVHNILHSSRLQPKLKVSESDDILEREADRVADEVMGMPDFGTLAPPGNPKISRNREDKSGPVALKSQANHVCSTSFATEPEPAVRVPTAGGDPLLYVTRTFFEPRFGYDFGDVRIHTDSDTAESAQALKSLAFTFGEHITFAPGQYTPKTDRGRRLLAHELTHVVQQRRDGQARIQRFEAPYHEAAERVGLTGKGGLTNEEATQVYFGNWMRDINQLFVPAFESLIPNSVRYALIKYLAVKKFGQTMSPEQLGYYIPAEHIDNPAALLQPNEATKTKGDLLTRQPYINGEFSNTDPLPDSGLGNYRTIQESVDPGAQVTKDIDANLFSVDQNGVMAYIHRSNIHIENRLTLAALRGRNPEGMYHFGAALHTIEDLFAHSNWIEIAVGRLLASHNHSELLKELTGEERQIFTYSATITDAGSDSGVRPILITGSFLTKDTIVSLSHELIKVLRAGLDPNEEDEHVAKAQEELIFILVKKYSPIAAKVIPFLPKLPFNFIPKEVYGIVNEALALFAGQIEAYMVEQSVSETSLLDVEKKNEEDLANHKAGKFSLIDEQLMKANEKVDSENTIKKQKAAAIQEGELRKKVFDAIPEHVMAGPSHSQISKDHSNSPFFGLAFNLAVIAVRRMREKMMKVWQVGGDTKAYQRPKVPKPHPNESGWFWEEGYKWPWDRVGSTPRTSYHFSEDLKKREEKSLELGKEIISTTIQENRLKGMRDESAETIHGIARDVLGIANMFRKIEGVQQKLKDKIKLDSRNLNTSNVQAPSSAERFFLTLGTELENIANQIGTATSYEQRNKINMELRSAQGVLKKFLKLLFSFLNEVPDDWKAAFSEISGLEITLSSILNILNRQVAITAVSFSPKQRELLQTNVKSVPIASRGFDLSEFPKDQKGAVLDLLKESRILMGHPYENDWWESEVTTYIKSHSKQIADDIRARNTGVGSFRHEKD